MPDKWIVSNPPTSVLTPVDKVPVPGVKESTMQRYTTAYGKWWMRVVEKSGFTYWMRLVPGEPAQPQAGG